MVSHSGHPELTQESCPTAATVMSAAIRGMTLQLVTSGGQGTGCKATSTESEVEPWIHQYNAYSPLIATVSKMMAEANILHLG